MPMLIASFLFQNCNLHALEFPYGPISLTLLDVAAITGHKPLGKTYALGLFEDQIERAKINIVFNAKTYGAFIEKNVRDTEEISYAEHIAFLMYWVSSHLIYTRSLQIHMYSYNLAQALHFKEDIFVLGSFCLLQFTKSWKKLSKLWTPQAK